MKMNVKIIGIGGAGLNMVNAVIDAGFEPENAVYIDTSQNAVCAAKTDNFLEIGAKSQERAKKALANLRGVLDE